MKVSHIKESALRDTLKYHKIRGISRVTQEVYKNIHFTSIPYHAFGYLSTVI